MKKFLLIIAICLLCGCSGKNENTVLNQGEQGAYIYYINSSSTALVSEPLDENNEDLVSVEGLLTGLTTVPPGEGYIAPLADITLLGYELTDGRLTIDFGREYFTLKDSREVLTRASVVKTLCQRPDVKTVEFKVAGEPLLDFYGKIVGAMDASRFVDYFGREQDSLVSQNVVTYYSTLDGAGLIREVHRVYYDSNLSKEQMVLRSLMDTPESGIAKTVLPKGINIIGLSVNEGSCYLDTDMSFYDQESNMHPNVVVYAIVNSLCELDEIREVHLNIIDSANDTDSSLYGALSGVYEKNTDYVRN